MASLSRQEPSNFPKDLSRVYARVDADGVVRCGCLDASGRQTCQVRFGEIITKRYGSRSVRFLRVDTGWAPKKLEDRPGYILRLNSYNRTRFSKTSQGSQDLANWRAKSSSKDRKRGTRARRDIDLDEIVFIECPMSNHGQQYLHARSIGVRTLHLFGEPVARGHRGRAST